jgi:translation initiation factor 3 subunit L
LKAYLFVFQHCKDMASGSDSALPQALTDFVFDLYDSVTLSQLSEEQGKLYDTDFRDLSSKYFGSQPWPSPQSIASECNGDPMFLALYRELTQRHWHAVSRPSIRDRIEGWQVYRELFEEILEADEPNFFLVPSWIFDILQEFVYQFQGFCQIRSAVYASARKQGILSDDGTIQEGSSSQSTNLVENLSVLQNAGDAWEVEAVYGYLHRMVHRGMPAGGATIHPVSSYLSLFSSVSLSRLDCLLGDYTSSLQALSPLTIHGEYVIPKDEGSTVTSVLHSVFPARISVVYHAGVSFLMLRRYKDAVKILADLCAYMQRGFKSGQLRKLPGSDQFNKQYERMLSLLAILNHICPTNGWMEDSVARVVREKHSAKLEAASSMEEWFQSPKFISTDPSFGLYRQQVQIFLQEMSTQPAGHKLRTYLKLYTSLPVEKLAKFHDMWVPDFLPLLLAYKLRMRQVERGEGDSYIGGTQRSALDIHYYLNGALVHVDEAEKTRQFENYFVAQIAQNIEIRRDALAIDTKV